MFPYLSCVNHQTIHILRQTDPYYPFYHNFPIPALHNHWLQREYLDWLQNGTSFNPNHVQSCKIEQSESIRYVIPQNIQNQHGKIQFRQKQTKQELLPKTAEEDAHLNAQKKALFLAKKKHLTYEDMQQLKRYRQMRLENYLAKKIKRTFQKKIVYTTRKRVADRRIRYKGKFINECQARQLLGVCGQQQGLQQLREMMKIRQKQ